MRCPHETPGGASRCALCRRAVLAAAGQLPRRPYEDRHPAEPRPPWFWDAVARARDAAARDRAHSDYTQPTLED